MNIDRQEITKEITDRAQQIGNDARELSRRVWLAGLGAVGTADERGRALLDTLRARNEELVERGKKVELDTPEVVKVLRQRGDEMNARVRDFSQRIERGVEDGMTNVLHRLGVPSRNDVKCLIDQVEKLNAKVESLATKA